MNPLVRRHRVELSFLHEVAILFFALAIVNHVNQLAVEVTVTLTILGLTFLGFGQILAIVEKRRFRK